MDKKTILKTLLPISSIALIGGGIASSLILTSCSNDNDEIVDLYLSGSQVFNWDFSTSHPAPHVDFSNNETNAINYFKHNFTAHDLLESIVLYIDTFYADFYTTYVDNGSHMHINYMIENNQAFDLSIVLSFTLKESYDGILAGSIIDYKIYNYDTKPVIFKSCFNKAELDPVDEIVSGNSIAFGAQTGYTNIAREITITYDDIGTLYDLAPRGTWVLPLNPNKYGNILLPQIDA